MKPARQLMRLAVLVMLGALGASAQTNAPTNSARQPTDESAFSIVSERNIFNANRSGGRVQIASSRRPTRVDSFTLVGTMAYEKGVFAFFEGSSSEFSKVLKANGIIAGYKLVEILANSVKLEIDGKQTELPVGSQMRREDEGTWRVAEAPSHSSSSETSYATNRESDSSSRSSRSSRSDSSRDYSRSDSSRRRSRDEESSSGRSDSSNHTASVTTNSGASEAEVLKRLMERREKD